MHLLTSVIQLLLVLVLVVSFFQIVCKCYGESFNFTLCNMWCNAAGARTGWPPVGQRRGSKYSDFVL